MTNFLTYNYTTHNDKLFYEKYGCLSYTIDAPIRKFFGMKTHFKFYKSHLPYHEPFWFDENMRVVTSKDILDDIDYLSMILRIDNN